MAEDALGEVYSGRDNSGSAFVIGPQSRRTAIDTYLDQTAKIAAQRAARQAAAEKMLDPGSFKAWDRDLPYMQKLRDDYTKLAVDYEQNIGKDKNADAVKYNTLLQKKDEMFHAAGASDAHRQIYEENKKLGITNRDKVAPDFLQKNEDFGNRPFLQRLGTEPQMEPSKIEWATEYGKTPEVGTEEISRELPDPNNSLLIKTQKSVGMKESEASDKADKWLSQMGNAQIAAIDDAKTEIGNDPKLKNIYDQLPSEKDRAAFAYNVAHENLTNIDRARTKTIDDKGLKGMPQPHVDGNAPKAKIKTIVELNPITETHDLTGTTEEKPTEHGIVNEGVKKFGVEKQGGFSFPKNTIQATDISYYDESKRKMQNVPGTQTIDVQDVNMYPFLKQPATYKTKSGEGKEVEKTLPAGTLLGRTTINELRKGMSKDVFDEVVGKKMYAVALLNPLSGSGSGESSIKIPYEQVRDKLEGDMSPEAFQKAREIETRLGAKNLYGENPVSKISARSKWESSKRKK